MRRLGRIPDGEYTLIDDTLQVVKSADLDADILQEIIDTLEAYAAGKATDTEVVEKVEADAPQLLGAVRDFLAKTEPISWIALLLAIL